MEELRVHGKGSKRGSRKMDGYDGNAGVVGGGRAYGDYDGSRRDGESYRGDRRSEMSEGLDGRRTILGEVSGRR